VELATASLAVAESDLADSRQRLPTRRYIHPSTASSAGGTRRSGRSSPAHRQYRGGTTLLTVSDMSQMFVMAEVHESDIGRLVETGRLGQEADTPPTPTRAALFEGRWSRSRLRSVESKS